MDETVFAANQYDDASSGIRQLRVGHFYIAVEREEEVFSHIRDLGIA